MPDLDHPQPAKPTLSWTTPADHRPAAIVPPSGKPPPLQEKNSAAWWIPGLCGFVAGIAAAFLWQYATAPSSQWEKGTGSATATTGAPAQQSADTGKPEAPVSPGYSRDSVAAVSPQRGGFSVTLESIAVSAPTWAVIYDDEEGMPGNALGARLFHSGEVVGPVRLLRATEKGRKYFVGLQTDDGDRKFELHGDAQVIDAEGRSVLSSFTIQ